MITVLGSSLPQENWPLCRMTDNTMVKRKMTKGQQLSTEQHRKLKIEEHETH
jgi:hypothetical protein